MEEHLPAQRWDEEYRRGRYGSEAPLAFTNTIVAQLKVNPIVASGLGLYVGCGNGRNYLQLIDAGFNVQGLDLSQEALDQIIARRPSVASYLTCGDFRYFSSTCQFTFLLAIQVFQHGAQADAVSYFAKVAELLIPGGFFCLRVNSVSTQIYHAHQVIERNQFGGITIQYKEGPKAGLAIHFFSWDELDWLTRDAFQPVSGPKEDIVIREPPKAGSWSQWEIIWKKR